VLTPSAKSFSVSISGTNWVMTGNDCPGYDWTSQTTPNKAQQESISVTVPLTPTIATTPTYVGFNGPSGTTNANFILGQIGIARNGVAIYSNVDALGRNAYIYEGSSFDTCGGHPDPTGEYHYHMEPTQGCVYTDTPGQHSPVFGMMYDGIPIFGELGDNGVRPTNLDYCGGHVDNTYPFYHYHLPAGMAIPYTVNCLSGCIFSANGNMPLQKYVTTSSSCQASATQYNYAALQSVWQAATATKSAVNIISFTQYFILFVVLLFLL